MTERPKHSTDSPEQGCAIQVPSGRRHCGTGCLPVRSYLRVAQSNSRLLLKNPHCTSNAQVPCLLDELLYSRMISPFPLWDCPRLAVCQKGHSRPSTL